MMRRAGDRRELERRILRAMKAKGISFRGLATETGLPPFTIAAALLGQVSLPNYLCHQCPLGCDPSGASFATDRL